MIGMDSKDVQSVVEHIVRNERFDALFTQAAQTASDVQEVRSDISDMKASISAMASSVDALAKSLDDLMLE